MKQAPLSSTVQRRGDGIPAALGALVFEYHLERRADLVDDPIAVGTERIKLGKSSLQTLSPPSSRSCRVMVAASVIRRAWARGTIAEFPSPFKRPSPFDGPLSLNDCGPSVGCANRRSQFLKDKWNQRARHLCVGSAPLCNCCGPMRPIEWNMSNCVEYAVQTFTQRITQKLEKRRGNEPVDWCLGIGRNPFDWRADAVPGPSDEAVIAAAGSYTVTVTKSQFVRSVVLNDPGAILDIKTGFELAVSGSLVIRSGTVETGGFFPRAHSRLAVL